MSGLVDSAGIFRIQTLEDIERLPPDARAVLVHGLDDAKLIALSRHPSLETIFSDGNSQATDHGVEAVARMANLVDLDLEWSKAISDRALVHLASAPQLRWVDLTGCTGVTSAGMESLRRAKPGIELAPSSE